MIARIVKQILGVLATGYILFYYSELVFWARVKPTDNLPEWISTWLAYSLLAFVFLTIVARFRVHTVWALFLAGAVFGWMTEGIVVQTAYEDLPLSLSFTGLAWHALISVWVGWYAVRRALFSGLKATLLVSAIIGFAYGLWAISWWVEPGEIPASPLEFAQYAILSTLLLVFACWLYDHTIPRFFAPNRFVVIAAGILFLLYFAFIAVPAAPLASVILPVLLLLIYLALRRNSQTGNPRAAASVLFANRSALALPRAAAMPASDSGPGLCRSLLFGCALAHKLAAIPHHDTRRFHSVLCQSDQGVAHEGCRLMKIVTNALNSDSAKSTGLGVKLITFTAKLFPDYQIAARDQIAHQSREVN